MCAHKLARPTLAGYSHHTPGPASRRSNEHCSLVWNAGGVDTHDRNAVGAPDVRYLLRDLGK